MSRKTYDIAGIENELRGASLFFPTEDPPPAATGPGTATKHAERMSSPPSGPNNEQADLAASENSTPATLPPKLAPPSPPQRHEIVRKQASKPASSQASMVEAIRRAVKDPGAKTSFVRLTSEEKNRLVDLVYTYKRQGVNTSENQLARIAIGFLLEDYQDCGKESMLAKVIAALNA